MVPIYLIIRAHTRILCMEGRNTDTVLLSDGLHKPNWITPPCNESKIEDWVHGNAGRLDRQPGKCQRGRQEHNDRIS